MFKDKYMHFGAGLLVFVVGLLLHSEMLGMILVIAAGVGKEAYDRLVNWLEKRKGNPPKHTPDPEDILATVGGGVAGVLLHMLYLASIK